MRFYFLYLKRLIQKHSKVILSLLAAIILIAVAVIKFSSVFLDDSVTEGIVGTFTPDDLPQSVTSLLSQGLIKLDSSGKPQPNLVDGWQVNNDATGYTLKLKRNLTWSDGSKVRAQDIPIAVSDAQVTTPDDDTIDIKLSDSFAPLPTLLEKPVLKKGTNIGIGPYSVTEMTGDIFVEKIILASSDSSLPRVTIKFYPNETTAKLALEKGEIESVLGINQPEDIVNQAPFRLISKTNYGRLVTIFYNTTDPVLSDDNFRLALSYAAPSIKGETEAKTSIPPTSWAFNPEVKDYLDNPKAAQSSLLRVKNGRDSVIILTTTSQLEKIGDQVVSAWNKQGIKATLKVESGVPQNFQALLITQDIPDDPDQYSLWHSTQSQTNTSRLSSPRVDKDLEDGRKISNLDDRKLKYLDFQKALLDKSPATFLYFPKLNVVYIKRIEGSLRKVLKLQLP